MCAYSLHDCDCVYVSSFCVHACAFGILHVSSCFYDLFISASSHIAGVFCVCLDQCVCVLHVSACVWVICKCALNPKQWVYV